ncbi:MAG: beta-propeller domain-containing protein [Candidatus Bathyarchaeota archaeon]|nr:beta-propeller domain-containing protein [Candidatus Bathyarchaeota archaeon]
MVQKEVTKKTRIYASAAVLSAIMLISVVYVFGATPIIFPDQAPSASGMRTFESMADIVNYLNSNSQGSNYVGGPLDNKFFGDRATISAPSPVTQGTFGDTSTVQESSSGAGSKGYSTTNIQVSGVDEADTVKTDGSYIYTISSKQNNYYYYDTYNSGYSNTVYILDANPQNAKVVSKISMDNNTQAAGLFLSTDGNKLVVIASKYQTYYGVLGIAEDSAPRIMPYYNSDVYTFIYVYDVSNKAAPALTRNLTMSGSYFNSRMIGDNVYAVISQPAVVYNDLVTLPAVYDDQVSYKASPTTIYYADMNDTSYTFTSFYGIDIANDAATPTNMTVLMGGASTMYVSPRNIYITYPNWDNSAGSYTAIYRVSINGLNLSLQAQGSVPGNLLNQYSMDEYNGYFRVATNWYGQDSQMNNIYVLNTDLAVTGKLEGLAPNENLHAVRFMGDKCYLVTFQQIDPLFVIDLSQPTNPTVLGELKIPGYSDYLHPFDETHLIGVGKEAVAANEGNFAYYQGLKLALFDVGNVNNPVQLSYYGIGDRGTDSEALYEPKAFLFDQNSGLLVIPVSLAVVSESDRQAYGDSAYGQTVWQGAYVFTVTLNGFTLKGTVTHIDSSLLNSQGQIRNYSEYWNTQNQWITRALYIDNTLYTVSNSQVKLNSLSNLAEIATVNLN